ncbi:unnamed protein product [Prorocentrum cordatum]|uniref:Glycosyl transferase CAP10 domain-containing protein n=1 Tax=Prorocentrum cordatum TaxID=2364126 RepID=A0ABN9VRQ8_9DINO|nr:unnamed protein product [Polarella glacialis]
MAGGSGRRGARRGARGAPRYAGVLVGCLRCAPVGAVGESFLGDTDAPQSDLLPTGALYGACGLGEAEQRRCCDPGRGPRGDASCWRGVFQFSTCCVPPPALHGPVLGAEEECEKHWEEGAGLVWPELYRLHSDVLADKLGTTISEDAPHAFRVAALQYLCCGQLLVEDAQRIICWDDLEALWPNASQNRVTEHLDAEEALLDVLFSRQAVRCCRGELARRLAGPGDRRLQRGIEDHLRTALRPEPSLQRAAAGLSIDAVVALLRPSELLAGLGAGKCCCRLRVRAGRLLPFECPTKRHGATRGRAVETLAAMMTLSYYKALLTVETLGFQLPDLEVMLSWHDFLLDSLGVPVLSQAANFHTKNALLMPDHKTVGGRVAWERQARYSLEAAASPWELKQPVLFWRGADSAPQQPYCAAWLQANSPSLSPHPFSHADLQGLPSCGAAKGDPGFGRQRAVRISHPLVDAKFTRSHAGADPETLARFATLYEQASKKWLLSLDGWANDFRPSWLPHAGSLLVRQRSPVRDWLDVSGFQSGAHFASVAANLSDVAEVLEWLSLNDARARAVAAEGRRFVERRASPDGAVEYLYRLLVAYARRMAEEP